jgi:uncharacterized membrane-anchored protein
MHNFKKHSIFLVAILILVGTLSFIIYTQESIVTKGNTIILKTRPVDPRDLFRGEYVILRYEIENDEMINLFFPQPRRLNEYREIYLLLERDSLGVGNVARVATQPPELSREKFWIRGEVLNGQIRFPSIEQFYVPEGAGLPIERLGSSLHVEVSIMGGEARIVRLLDENLDPIDPRLYIEK